MDRVLEPSIADKEESPGKPGGHFPFMVTLAGNLGSCSLQQPGDRACTDIPPPSYKEQPIAVPLELTPPPRPPATFRVETSYPTEQCVCVDWSSSGGLWREQTHWACAVLVFSPHPVSSQGSEREAVLHLQETGDMRNSGGLKSTRHLGPERAVGKRKRTWGRILQLCIC